MTTAVGRAERVARNAITPSSKAVSEPWSRIVFQDIFGSMLPGVCHQEPAPAHPRICGGRSGKACPHSRSRAARRATVPHTNPAARLSTPAWTEQPTGKVRKHQRRSEQGPGAVERTNLAVVPFRPPRFRFGLIITLSFAPGESSEKAAQDFTALVKGLPVPVVTANSFPGSFGSPATSARSLMHSASAAFPSASNNSGHIRQRTWGTKGSSHTP